MSSATDHERDEKVPCTSCQITNRLQDDALPLGDIVIAALGVLSPTDIQWGVTHLIPSTRARLMRSLALPAPRKPTVMFASHFGTALRRATPAMQRKIAIHLTYSVIQSLLDLLDGDEIDIRLVVDQLLASIPQGMIRLALCAHWNRIGTLGPYALKGLLDDERLTLGAWAPFAEQIVPECEAAIVEVEALDELNATPVAEDPDEFGDEHAAPDAAELVELAREALDAAASVVTVVETALRDGLAPPSQAVATLFEASAAFEAAGEALGIESPPPISLARLDEALADLVAEEELDTEAADPLRTTLTSLLGATTTGAAGAALSALCLEAANILLTDSWSDEERRRASQLADLVAVIEAAQRDDEESIDLYAERLSSAVDTNVIVAATRGRISLAELSNKDTSASQSAKETKNEVADATDRDVPTDSDIPEPPPAIPELVDTAGEHVPIEEELTPTAPVDEVDEVAEDASDTDLTIVDDEGLANLDDLIAEYIASRRFGIAAWVVQASNGNQGFVEALRVAALADVVRSPHGASAPELDRRAASLSGHTLDGISAGRLLALVSALRVTLLHPQGSLSGLIPELSERVGAIPGLQAIVNAVTRAAQRGLSLTADLLPAAQSVASVEERVALAVEAAARELSQPRSTTFARGTRILSVWTGSDGLITRLLDVVRENDLGRRAYVESEVRRLRNRREVEGEIDFIDKSLRGPGARRIDGQVRRAIAGHVDRAVEVASEWLDALAQLEAHRPDSERWQEVPLRELRDAIKPERERVLSALRALGEDPVVSAVGRSAAAMLGEVLDLLDGHPLPGPERSPFMALHDELLKSSDAVMTDDLDVPTDVPLSIVLEAARRNWLEGFKASCARNQFDVARAIVARVALDDADIALTMERECTDLLVEAQSLISARRQPLVAAVNEARRSGFIDEDTWGSLTLLLTEADPIDRIDLGRCDATLDRITQSLSEARQQAQVAFDAEFASKRAELSVVEEQASVIARLAAAGDLATARDVMVRAEAGDDPLTVEPTGEHVATFFPALPDALAKGLHREDVDQLESLETVAGINLEALSAGEREIVVRGLRAWVDLKSRGNARPTLANLAPALRLLGVEADTEGTSHLPGGPDRRWVDLVGVRRTGRSLVPAFGSTSGSHLRLLCCWGSPDASTTLALIAQDASERPVIVLYFGTLSVGQRRALAIELRARPARPIIVVDDATVLYLAGRGGRRFETLMQVTLPFASVNPYEPDVAGAVPTEMFYGRLAERRSVIEARGTSLIYGGRQLGKSALLHAGERRFEEVSGQVAIYVDLRGAAIGATKRPDAVWDPIVDGLIAKRVVDRRPARKDPAAAAEEIINAYLESDPGHHVLLLLDECDDFFDADAEARFSNLTRLRQLMDATDRRFKVVFAGLHQVQRFSAIPNQPLAHLGQPQVIGPLAPQPAFDLLHGPLEALGFDIGDDLAARLMANANYQPLALQLYGRALIDVLRRRPFSETLPTKVLPSDVDAVLGDEALNQQIRQRFELTLRLDPRYRVIAYAVAYRAHVAGHEHPITTEALRHECQDWWAEGFAQLRPDEFRSLVEEMVGLGVLVAVPGGWRLRSPNVLRMLGTVQQIEDALVEAESETPPAGFAAAEARRVIDTTSRLRSPLSESQLADLLAPGTTWVHIVLGSQACGVDAVRKAVDAAAGPRLKLYAPRNKGGFKSNLRAGGLGDHVVVVSELDATSETIGASVDTALATPPADGITRSVILVVTSANLDWWPLALALNDERVAVVELRRHSPRSLWAWAVDVPGAFQDERSRAELLEVTGGWPYLVDRAGAWVGELSERGGVREEIFSRIRRQLATREGSIELVEAVGLRSDEAAIRLYEMILALGGAPEDREDIVELADGDFDRPGAAIEALCALGVLVVDRDGRVHPEPVFREAFMRSLEIT